MNKKKYIYKIIFNNIKFINLKLKDFKKIIKNYGLFLFPSGPGLATIHDNKFYYQSLKKADYVFLDSGYFVLILKFFKNINVTRFSGYKFLNHFFKHIKKNKEISIFCIDPNLVHLKANLKFLNSLGIKNIQNYVAPKYNKYNIKDKTLLKKINNQKPRYVIINLGGGTQEILGSFLVKNLKFKTSILCTGGAISFFTKLQAPINPIIDKFYLGWLMRIFFDPKTFLVRYLNSFKLIKLVIGTKIQLIYK